MKIVFYFSSHLGSKGVYKILLYSIPAFTVTLVQENPTKLNCRERMKLGLPHPNLTLYPLNHVALQNK